MEAFYEESSIASNAKRGARRYKVWAIFTMIFLILGILTAFFTVWMIPTKGGVTGDWLMLLATTMMLWGFWFFFRRLKLNSNVSYDYCFVSGELRISKVVNINRRRLVAKFDVDDIIQIGDIDSPSFDRFFADPTAKKVYCTSNDEAAEGKFFMYILANHDGKKLFLLECREALLMNIMKFAKRTALDHDYVMQDKKQKRV